MGAQFFGGWTFERQVAVTCHDPDNPNNLFFCDQRKFDIPFLHEFKLSGTVPLKWGVQVSGSLQSYPAQEVDRSGRSFGGTLGGGLFDLGDLFGALDISGDTLYNVPTSDFTRNGLTATVPVTIPLLPHGSAFFDRLNQVDFSIQKWFDLPNGMRWQIQADIYNIINAGPAIDGLNTFGSRYMFPTQTLQARFLQLTTQLKW